VPVTMIETIKINSFKSLRSVEVNLGKLNVFIGANGSGKSNLLEAIGVLSAAAHGRINDGSLLNRGVRPGVPKLYKSSFHKEPAPPHIALTACNTHSTYSVSLNNPLDAPEPDWMYKHEKWTRNSRHVSTSLASRSPRKSEHKKLGMAALKAFGMKESDLAYKFLKTLQEFRIYTPTTNVLRGVATDTQPSFPMGLSGGGLPIAVGKLLEYVKKGNCYDKITDDFFPLISWAKEFSTAKSTELPLSPSAALSPEVIRFVDKYMTEGRNELSGYDVSEGALYVLFLTVLVILPESPVFCAIDNADYGLNPLLAKQLFNHLSRWMIDHTESNQLLITIHNPLVLDGLLLNNDQIRLFTVNRNLSGMTEIKRVLITDKHLEMAAQGWTLSRLWTNGYLGGIYNV